MTEEEEKLNPCPVCQRPDKLRPMCYRGEPWCSDRCRKVIQGEVEPTRAEYFSMSKGLLIALTGGNIMFATGNDDVQPEVGDFVDSDQDQA